MFNRKKETPDVERIVEIQMITLPPEYRNDFLPSDIETALLETFTLQQINEFLSFFTGIPQQTIYSTAVVDLSFDIFGTMTWDVDAKQIVLPLAAKQRHQALTSQHIIENRRDMLFTQQTLNIQRMATFVKYLIKLNPLIGTKTP